MKILEVRSALFVKFHPDFETVYRESLKVDVTLQTESVQVLDAHRSYEPVDLSDVGAGLRVFQYDAFHLDRPRRERNVKILYLCLNTVLGESIFDLPGYVTVDKP